MATIYDLSAKYESHGDPASISSGQGDLGGISYGIYQLSSKSGSVQAFLDFACAHSNELLANYGVILSQYEINSGHFIEEWKNIGINDRDGFSQLQNEYAKLVYFDRADQYLHSVGYEICNKSVAMQAVLMSRAVQYSAGNMIELFLEAVQRLGHPNLSYVNDRIFDKDMITNIYNFLIDECNHAYELANGLYHSPKDWANGSFTVVKVGLRNRFINERNDALMMLGDNSDL
ncbi:hypothetical protein HA075_25540 [bacterium BFN5]|nr:hypothetical protein HA075_25540 [bacterium BFN5]